MEILAIEKFKSEEYLEKAEEYLEENQGDLLELYNENILRSFWAREDKAGTILILEAPTVDDAKRALAKLPLVKKGVLSYNIVPLKPFTLHKPPPKGDLTLLVYCSAETKEMKMSSINAILKKSRENNKKKDITGMLLYHQGSFLQILEGYERDITALYNKIATDPRHNNIAKIFTTKIEERTFSEWSMGHVEVSENEIEDIDGLNDFFADGSCYTDLNEGQVKKILAAFKDGKWRQKLS